MNSTVKMNSSQSHDQDLQFLDDRWCNLVVVPNDLNYEYFLALLPMHVCELFVAVETHPLELVFNIQQGELSG